MRASCHPVCGELLILAKSVIRTHRWENRVFLDAAWPPRIADAFIIMRWAGPAIDWERFVRIARKHQLVFGLHRMLHLLQWQFAMPIPHEVLAELSACPTGWVERMEHRLTNCSPGEPPMLWRLWFSHLRWNRGAGLADVLLTFPRHLQYAFDLQRMSELPGFAVSRTAFKVGQIMFRRGSHSQGGPSATST